MTKGSKRTGQTGRPINKRIPYHISFHFNLLQYFVFFFDKNNKRGRNTRNAHMVHTVTCKLNQSDFQMVCSSSQINLVCIPSK